MARVARRRRAEFRRGPSGLEPADAASAAILRATTDDVAAYLGFADAAAYDAATPEERQQHARDAVID